MKDTYVIVGFRVREENSVHYAKAKTVETMLENVRKAFEKGAEFISLRKISEFEKPNDGILTKHHQILNLL